MRPEIRGGVLYAPKRWESPGIVGDGMEPVERSDPQYDELFLEATGVPPGWDTMVASTWDESKHPRDPGGEGGGQWIEANGQTALLEPESESDEPVMGLGAPGRAEAVAAQERTPDQETRDAWEANLRTFMEDAPLLMRVPESAMMEIFNDGEFYNQHQSETARGMPRSVKGEASMLGLPEGTTAEGLPKYGYMGGDTEATNMYGAIKLTFKDEVKKRSTFTIGDSLMTDPLPSKMTEPRWQSVQTSSAGIDPLTDYHESLMNGDLEYMEAQIYGKLTPDDIESVEVLDEDYWEDEDPLTGMPLVENIGQMGAVLDELTKRKIPWSTYRPEGDFSGEWA